MDPLSIAGFVLAIGQSIGPIVSGIRALRRFKEIEHAVEAALEQSDIFCVKIQLWLEAIGDIEETSLSPTQLEFLRRTLSGLQVAAESHEMEVRKWLQALGLSDTVLVEGAARGSETTLAKRDAASESSSSSRTIVEGSRSRKVLPRLAKLVRFGPCTWGSRDNLEETEVKEKTETQSQKASGASKPNASIATRLHFIILGECNVEHLASDLVKWDNQLFTGYMMITTTCNLSHSKLGKDFHPTIRFIMEAKERIAQGGSVTFIEPEVWRRYYDDHMKFVYVDKNATDSSTQGQVLCGDFVPKYEDPNDEVGKHLESYRRCIFINRGPMEGSQREASQALARSFSVEQDDVEVSDKRREDGDMLRCVAMANVDGNCILLFKLPPGSSSNPMTLRTALLDPRAASGGYILHPISDRVKLATRLTTAVFVLHSLGLVHKRINPEKILLVESAGGGSSQSFPKRLGYAYLVAFHSSREIDGYTELYSHREEAALRGIYFHFRDQDTERNHRFTIKDDIYSLGVCLFEIALRRSLFVWSPTKRDYVYDDSFVGLSDNAEKLRDLNEGERPLARAEELIRVAEERIPGVLGHSFTKAVIACLNVHSDDNPFADYPRLRDVRNARVSKEVRSDNAVERSEQEIYRMECFVYLELVLHHLQPAC